MDPGANSALQNPPIAPGTLIISTDVIATQSLTWARRLALIALTFIALAMLAKAALATGGIVVSWRTPPLDQSTGVALAAIAYVLSR